MNNSKTLFLVLILVIMISIVFGIYIVTSPKPVQEIPKAAETKPILSFDINPADKAGEIELIVNVDPQGAVFYTSKLNFSFAGDISLPDNSVINRLNNDFLMAKSEIKGNNIEVNIGKPDPYFNGYGKIGLVSLKMKRGVGAITFTWNKTITEVTADESFTTGNGKLIAEDRTFPAITTEPIIIPTIGVIPPKEEIIAPTVVQPPPTTIKAPQGLVCNSTATGAVCNCWASVENAVNYKVKIIGETGESNYNTNTPSFTMTDGIAGKTYTFKVAVEAASGAISDWSTTQFTVLLQQPTITPTIIITQPPTTTTTTGNVTLNLSLAFHGVLKKPTGSNTTMPVRITLTSPNYSGDKSVKSVTFTATDRVVNKMVVWDGQQVTFNDVPQGNDYAILIKGPKHTQKRICVENPTETPPGRYSCSLGKIALKPNDVKTLDYSTVIEWSGDLPNQDGMIDSYDMSLIRNYIDQKIESSPEALAKADINLDNLVNTMDFSLLIQSLQNRADEQ